MSQGRGKNVLITGASGGIGMATALYLAEKGYSVIGAGRSMARLAHLREQASERRLPITTVEMDINSDEGVAGAMPGLIERHGSIDVVVNNAGGSMPRPFPETREQDFEEGLRWNVTSAFNLSQLALPHLVASGAGSIINIASVTSHLPLSKVIAYSASKAAVLSATRFLAREWATTGVRVNSITPGFFPAEQNKKLLFNEDGTPSDRAKAIFGHTPMGRFGDPSELAGAAVYLASEKAASFVTGSDIVVDGGFLSTTI
mgnify:CR=1 FL=1